MESLNPFSRLSGVVKKYRHALLVLLIGLALMLLPTGQTAQKEVQQLPQNTSESADLETRLEQILSKISGAGEVAVLLTCRTGEETMYQSDGESDTGESGSRESSSTILVEDENHRQTGLIRRTDPPVYQGALVVCGGADRPEVKLAIVEAVRCVTGLGADQITVVKMK